MRDRGEAVASRSHPPLSARGPEKVSPREKSSGRGGSLSAREASRGNKLPNPSRGEIIDRGSSRGGSRGGRGSSTEDMRAATLPAVKSPSGFPGSTPPFEGGRPETAPSGTENRLLLADEWLGLCGAEAAVGQGQLPPERRPAGLALEPTIER